MPLQELEYPKEALNKVKRLNERATYALESIHRIINSADIVHVSFNAPGSDSPWPVTLPMIGQMGSFSRPSADLGDVLDVYLHGYVSARMMNSARDSPSAKTSDPAEGSASTDADAPTGLPVTITASFNDGLVLSLSPFHNSYNYRSAVLYGHATPVTAADEKLYALELITDSVVPGRWAASRQPPTAAELSSTSVLRVRVRTGSAKIRKGHPHDDRADLADDSGLRQRVWTGVVPVLNGVRGDPVDAPDNKADGGAPRYIRDFIRDGNEDAKAIAADMMVEE